MQRSGSSIAILSDLFAMITRLPKLLIAKEQLLASHLFPAQHDAPQVAFNTSLRTLGQSSSPSPIFDFPGAVFFSNLTFKPIDDTQNWPYPQLASAQTTAKLTPTMMGNVTSSVRVAGDYSAAYYDQYIGVTDTSASRTITLHNLIMPDQELTVKDESLAAASHPITVVVDGEGLIEGSASKQINTNGGCIRLKFDGTNYFII